jgi:hypothetical protein
MRPKKPETTASEPRGGVCPAAGPRQSDQEPAAAPARLETVFLPRPGGRMHRKGQRQCALRVRRQGLDRHHQRPRPGRSVLHAKALPGNPYDGHTLRDVIEDTQKLTGCEIERGYVDKGYRGHDAQNPRRIFISGQKRGKRVGDPT